MRLGASVTVGTACWPAWWSVSAAGSPEGKIEAAVNNTHVVEEMLLHGRLDLAFVEGRIRSPYLEVTPVVEDRLVLVCHPDHPFAGEREVTLEQLAGQTLLRGRRGAAPGSCLNGDLEDGRLSLRGSWSCSNSEAIKNALLHNLGVSVLSALLVKEELEKGRLRAVRVVRAPGGEPFLWKRPFSLVIHRTNTAPPPSSR